ncbi:MAG: hypothetical protein WA771_14625 [Chthoniobacterales bacterium]
MGYLLAIIGFFVLLLIIFAVLPNLRSGAADMSGRGDAREVEPHPEKQQTTAPQEEFIDDSPRPSHDRDVPTSTSENS